MCPSLMSMQKYLVGEKFEYIFMHKSAGHAIGIRFTDQNDTTIARHRTYAIVPRPDTKR